MTTARLTGYKLVLIDGRELRIGDFPHMKIEGQGPSCVVFYDSIDAPIFYVNMSQILTITKEYTHDD